MSSKVLDAASDPLRLRILKLLHTQGPLSYSDIMSSIKLHPSRDAGKFAYHLRRIRQSGLVMVDNETKKYMLTPLGGEMVDFSRSLEEYALKKRGKLLVRTSRLTLEEFDQNKIAKSLIKEAKIPTALAQKIVGEVEERLLKLGTLYLTAPLIREFVNAVLIEKGLKEYRDKLTRLGLPVYDVSHLIKMAGNTFLNVEAIRNSTSDSIMTEYVLINAIPQGIANAHLSGFIHISDLGSWILKPFGLQHDSRVFLKDGFKPGPSDPLSLHLSPPKTFHAALSLMSAIVESATVELAGEQVMNYFNTFLAPFVRHLSFDEVKEALRLFIFNLSQSSFRGFLAEVALGVDSRVPGHLEKVEVFGSGGDAGCYGDFVDEAHEVLRALLEAMVEDDFHLPVFRPRLIFNLRPGDFDRKEAESSLIQVHKLASRYGTPLFANLVREGHGNSTYFTLGTKLGVDWTLDWDLDTLRTGVLGTTLVNLPRLSYEAKGNDDRFIEILDEYINMACKTLRMKHRAIEERLSQLLLPTLSRLVPKDPYFRHTNASQLVGFIGLSEAVKTQTGSKLYEAQDSLNFAKKIIEHARDLVKSLSKKFSQRVVIAQTPSDEASQRLAELDADQYGWSSIYNQGTKDAPYYTDIGVVPLEADIPLRERLRIEGDFHALFTGGQLTLIELDEPEQDPEKLLDLTKSICLSSAIGAFAYTRSLSYCNNCKKVFGGHLAKCLKCESVDSLTLYDRASARYLPLSLWPVSKRKAFDRRVRYMAS